MHMNDYKIFFLNYIKVTQYTTKKGKRVFDNRFSC